MTKSTGGGGPGPHRTARRSAGRADRRAASVNRSALHRLAVGLSLAMVLAGSPATGQDQPLAAETLLDQCVSESLNAREACAAFILKSVDRNRAAPEPAYCLPASAILGDLRARFIAWGETRRGRLDMPADDGLAAALAEAFPCPLTQSG